MTKHYNKTAKNEELQEGDLVFVKDELIPLKANKKFRKYWDVPHVIIKKYSPLVYKVKKADVSTAKPRILHRDKLKKIFQPQQPRQVQEPITKALLENLVQDTIPKPTYISKALPSYKELKTRMEDNAIKEDKEPKSRGKGSQHYQRQKTYVRNADLDSSNEYITDEEIQVEKEIEIE